MYRLGEVGHQSGKENMIGKSLLGTKCLSPPSPPPSYPLPFLLYSIPPLLSPSPLSFASNVTVQNTSLSCYCVMDVTKELTPTAARYVPRP